jgi:hypothetical protein
MDLKQILESLLVNEPNSNFGFLSSDEVGKVVEEIAIERVSNPIDFSAHIGKKFPFFGEHFENIVVEDDENLKAVASEVSRVLQKNRYLILITSFSIEEVTEVFQPLKFSNISEIETGETNIFMLKRWFEI